jgi:protein-L-isoaspartate(D-aspartate) O-methyltransferase
MRRRLAEDLRKKGNFDEKIILAIENIPRHFFLESAFAEQAYEDKAFPIGADQTISQPYTVAYQTQLLNVKPGDKILEIGTGSGYQAAILSMLDANVFSIERIALLSEQANTILRHLKLKARLYIGDGTLGLPKKAPFDKILITAAAPDIPETLLNQLAIGGILVSPVGNKNVQTMIRVTKKDENNYDTEEFETFRFVPLIGEKGFSV